MPSGKSASFGAVLFTAFPAIALFFAVTLNGQQRQALPTRLSAPTGIKAVGRLPGSQRLNLAITLPLRNQEELQSLLHDLYDPANPNYRHFLTVEQFTERFGPTTDDHERVASFARSSGLTVTHTAPNRLVLNVSGTVADVERAFHVTMQVYQHPTEPRTFYAPDVEPSLDSSIPVQGVQGLSTFSLPHPVNRTFAPLDTATPQGSALGSAPGGLYLGSDLRAAYAPGVTLDGTGQIVGLFEMQGYNLSDVQTTFSNAKQTLKVPITNVILDSLPTQWPSDLEDTEPVMDIVAAASMAPNLSSLLVYEGDSDVDILNQMAADNAAKEISISWTWDADPSSAEPIFKELAAQGQSVFASSGDNGAYGTDLYPASDPFVTTVGGTVLSTTVPGGAWAAETAGTSSGGGITSYPIQSDQTPLINSQNQGSTTYRNVPDVAANATGFYVCSNGGTCGGSGGTSLATPLWAGFTALANQNADGTTIGFLNPIIYQLAQGSNYSSDFHDITSGNNFTASSPSLYSAVTGYDLVTGLGSPYGQNLINALAPVSSGPNFTLASSPSTISITPGSQGSSTISVNALNGYTGSVTLSATVLGQTAGVTVGLSQTSVTGPGNTTLDVSLANTAISSPVLIQISGTGGGLAHITVVKVTVEMSDLVETAVSTTPTLLTAGGSFSVTDSVQNNGIASAGSSVTGYYLSATTTKTASSLSLGSRTVPALAVGGVSTGSATVTVPSSIWPRTPYFLLACANDTGTVVEANSSNCIASSSSGTSSAAAPPGTVTTLSITSGGSPVGSVNQGSMVTLTATVVNGTSPVTTGQVNFCDATAPLCSAIHLIGTAQLTSTGNASLTFVPSIGSHSYKAVFRGVINAGGSFSSPLALTVAGKYTTQTTIAQSGSVGDYTLLATVTGTNWASPTGEISILDTSNGNSVLGTAALSAGTSVLNWTSSQTPAASPSKTYPYQVAVGDFNGDGIPDLAIADGFCTVTIQLGIGDGTFRTVARPTVPCSPSSIAVGDFNGDGNLDLAVSTLDPSNASGSVTILLGNGDGTFTLSASHPATDSYPNFIATGDFNGDGKADLAITSYNPNYWYGPGTVRVLLGNGDGTFSQAGSITTDYAPDSIAVGDFNGDGKQDLAVSNGEHSTLTVLLGNGDGTFTEISNPLSDSGDCSWKVVTADFNGDGKADLALTITSPYNEVIVLLGNGDGTFTEGASINSGGYFPSDLALGDFNGDGKVDLAVLNNLSQTFTILLGNGDGTFTAASSTPSTGSSTSETNYPYFFAVGDFNADGSTDLIVPIGDSNNATVLLSESSSIASASASGISPIGTGTHQVEASYPGNSNYSSSVSVTTGLPAVTKTTPTVTVTPSASSITTAQALTVTVAVSGTPTPTGAVTLSGGGYTSAATTLTSGSASISIPAGKLATGSDTLTATYTPDSNSSSTYNTATGTSSAVTVTQAMTTPTVTVTPSASSITTAQALTVTVAVSGGSGNPTPTGLVTLSGGGYTSAATTLSSGSASISIPAGSLATGSDTLTASYTGDATYEVASATTTVTVEPVSITTTTPSPVSPGSSTTSSVTLTGSSSYSGTMNLSCSLASSPAGAQSLPTCTLNPASVTLASGGSGTSTLTVNTTAASTTALARPADQNLWKLGGGGAVFAALLLFGIPFRRRRWTLMLALLLFVAAAGAIGCGGGGGGGGGGGSSTPATTAGSYVFTVTGTDSASAKITASSNVSITVQ
jgi:hypothetical protein